MDELNKVAEQLIKLNEKDVRVVYIPASSVAMVYAPDDNPDTNKEPHQGVTKSIMQNIINNVNLFTIKPDTRVFGWGDFVNGKRVYIMAATIPDDLEVSAPLQKSVFPGGLYAMHPNDPLLIDEWVENNDNYEGSSHGPGMEEIINPINLFDVNASELSENAPVYINYLHPVRTTKILTKEENQELFTKLKILDDSLLQKLPTMIDLMTMEKYGDIELKYANGFMVMKAEGWQIGKGMKTTQEFSAPLKIELRVKTDSADLTLKYAKGIVVFNWKPASNKLLISDIWDGKLEGYKKHGSIPIDEFVDIVWLIGKEIMVVTVNGELRHISSEFDYIKALKENSAINLSSPVSVAASEGSTVTVESLKVTEM